LKEEEELKNDDEEDLEAVMEEEQELEVELDDFEK
jgi:hypothetical protein